MRVSDDLSCLAAEDTDLPDGLAPVFSTREIDAFTIWCEREVPLDSCVVCQAYRFAATDLPQPQVRRAAVFGDEDERPAIWRDSGGSFSVAVVREPAGDRFRN